MSTAKKYQSVARREKGMKTEYRVRLETRDGQLVQNRVGDPSFWVNRLGEPIRDFAEISLAADCRERGCRLISYTVDKNGVFGVVEWLK